MRLLDKFAVALDVATFCLRGLIFAQQVVYNLCTTYSHEWDPPTHFFAQMSGFT